MDRYTKVVLTVIALALVWIGATQGGAPAALAQEGKATSGQGRFQLVAGRYSSARKNGTVEYDSVFRIDTVTGKTHSYMDGVSGVDGKLITRWSLIDEAD